MASNPSPKPSKKIVILGGSYAGLSVAHHLLKHTISALPPKDPHQILLISASAEVICRPACPRALLSDSMFPQEKLFVSIPDSFSQYPTETFLFIHGAATKLDHANRTVSITMPDGVDEAIDFHAIILATGASTPSPLLGLNRDSEFLRSQWKLFRAVLPSAKTIVIAGGGPAGIETAGELGEYLNGRAGHFSSSEPKVTITVLSGEDKILPALRPAIALQAEKYLAAVGVTVRKNARVMGVAPLGAGTEIVDQKATLTLEDGSTVDADLYIPATGTRPNSGFVGKELLTENGKVEVNGETLRVQKAGPRVYALGDLASAARPAVHNILEQVPVVCANIKRDLLLAAGGAEGEVGVDKVFKEDKREMQLVAIGRNKGVGAAMGWRLPSFLVWLIKGRDYWLWTTGNLWSGKQWAKES